MHAEKNFRRGIQSRSESRLVRCSNNSVPLRFRKTPRKYSFRMNNARTKIYKYFTYRYRCMALERTPKIQGVSARSERNLSWAVLLSRVE